MRKFCLWLLPGLILGFSINLFSSQNQVHALSFFSAHVASADELISEVNALRVSNGLPPYNVNSILMQIAQSHANYQASIGTGTHYSADGSRPFQRALAAGYPVAGDLSRGGFFSENIIWSSEMSASQAVSAWQGDAPHLNTMLSPNLQDVGAGVASSGDVTFYTLDAARASGSPVSYTPPPGTTLGAPGTEVVSDFMLPVTISTPNESGAVYHEVQFGQTLWSLAVAYETKVEQIKKSNNLTTIDIYEGQKLLIKLVPTPTATALEAEVTETVGAPTSTATSAASMTPTNTPQPVAPASARTSGVVLFSIIATAFLAAGLGTWISTCKPV